MKSWIKTSLILCVFGFLIEFRPNDAYYTLYLVGPWKNFTGEQVNQQMFPVITYSQLAVLVLVFLVTDMLRYKPIIILLAISLTLYSVLSLVGMDVFTLQVGLFFFGVYLASTVAYFTYIYAKVDRKYYEKVTSHAQVAILLGRFTSSITGQLLVSTGVMDYQGLTYITIAACSAAILWAFVLPSARQSVYFHTNPDLEDNPVQRRGFDSFLPSSTQHTPSFTLRCIRAWTQLWNDFKYAYTNLYVLKWSLWWSVATCGYFQNFLYVQLLWENISRENPVSYSDMTGTVHASYTAIGAVGAFACGWLRLNWVVLGDVTLAGCAVLQGVAVIVASYSEKLVTAYVGCVVFASLYHTMITVVNAEIAKHINEDSYGLIFGVNTFFALILQTILTLVVAGEGGFALPPRQQFLVYGSSFIVLGSVFAMIAAVSLFKGKLRDQPLWLPKDYSSPKY